MPTNGALTSPAEILLAAMKDWLQTLRPPIDTVSVATLPEIEPEASVRQEWQEWRQPCGTAGETT